MLLFLVFNYFNVSRAFFTFLSIKDNKQVVESLYIVAYLKKKYIVYCDM